MKRIRIKALKAIKKGLVKVGDIVLVERKIESIKEGIQGHFTTTHFNFDDIFVITKPEPNPIDFGKAGLVLKGEFSIIQTTGYCGTECFSGIYLNGNCTKGFTSNGFIKDQNMWQDITENYYLNNPK